MKTKGSRMLAVLLGGIFCTAIGSAPLEAKGLLEKIGEAAAKLKQAPQAGTIAESESGIAPGANSAQSPASALAPLPGDFGTPDGTARLAAIARSLPDVGGIRLGMPLGEAQAALQKLVKNEPAQPNYTRLKELPGHDLLESLSAAWSDPNAQNGAIAHSDSVSLGFTTYPSTESVSYISRSVRYTVQDAPGFLNTQQALIEKYGEPTLSDPGAEAMLWVYDASGKHVGKSQFVGKYRSTEDLSSGGCERGQPPSALMALNGIPDNIMRGCSPFAFLYVRLTILPANWPEVQKTSVPGIPKDWSVYKDWVVADMDVSFRDFPLGLSGAQALRTAALDVDRAKQAQEAEKAKQRQPDL